MATPFVKQNHGGTSISWGRARWVWPSSHLWDQHHSWSRWATVRQRGELGVQEFQRTFSGFISIVGHSLDNFYLTSSNISIIFYMILFPHLMEGRCRSRVPETIHDASWCSNWCWYFTLVCIKWLDVATACNSQFSRASLDHPLPQECIQAHCRPPCSLAWAGWR